MVKSSWAGTKQAVEDISQFGSAEVMCRIPDDCIDESAAWTWSVNCTGKACISRYLTDAIHTATPSSRFFFHVMASLAEMERELTVERTRAGLEVARQLGRKGGRKRQMTDSKIESAKKLLASGIPPRDVATNLGISVPTLYRWIPASGRV